MKWDYFIRNTLGFFLQLYPCLLLCCRPFEAYRWKIEKKKFMGIMAGVVFVSAMIFPWILKIWNQVPVEVVGNLYMVMAIIVCVSIFFRMVNTEWYKKAFVTSIVLYYGLTQYVVVNFILKLITKEEQIELYSCLVILLYGCTMIVLFPLFFRTLGYIQKRIFLEMHGKKIQDSLLMVSGITAAYVIAMCIFSTVLHWNEEKRDMFVEIFELILYLFVGGQFIHLYRLSFWKIAQMEQERMQRQEIELRNLQYKKITGEIERARRQRHDQRHHMRLLTALLKENKVSEALDHIAKVYEENESLELRQFCENITLNALFTYYVGMAQEEGITCQIQAEMPEGIVDSLDLTIVFGNCLENAIEAARDTKEKQISVEIGIVNHAIGVRMENSCELFGIAEEAETDLSVEQLKSSKEHGGIGLKSVDWILKKYESGPIHCTYSSERKRFSLWFLWYWGEGKKSM